VLKVLDQLIQILPGATLSQEDEAQSLPLFVCHSAALPLLLCAVQRPRPGHRDAVTSALIAQDDQFEHKFALV